MIVFNTFSAILSLGNRILNKFNIFDNPSNNEKNIPVMNIIINI